jgi:hypothetical protein
MGRVRGRVKAGELLITTADTITVRELDTEKEKDGETIVR